MTKYKIIIAKANDKEGLCSICLSNYIKGKKIAILKCKHNFH